MTVKYENKQFPQDKNLQIHRSILALGMCLGAILVFVLTPGTAGADVGLAQDHPYATTFLQMARRAAADYMAKNRELPVSDEQLMNNGYTAYLFPAALEMELSAGLDGVAFEFESNNSYTHGEITDIYAVAAAMPQTELSFTKELPIWTQQGSEMVETIQDVTIWSFRGAEWLSQGYGWSDVEPALKRDRIVTHLVWVSREYQYDHSISMPGSLEELETYVGVARNPACWDAVQEVGWLDEVAYSQGNLFVGWDGDEWCISCNLGPETVTYRYNYSDLTNEWVVGPFLGIY